MPSDATIDRFNPWPNRLAKLLAAVAFPLIWVGGLVTTSDAGMAVPNWPNTYNYNMLAYPLRDWLLGPWDLFVEHGHRLLGMLAGMIAIALCVGMFAADTRRWARHWSVLVLGMVIAQGILGGQRVVHDARTLALVHGCVGPAFFALVVAMIVFTSRWWRSGRGAVEDEARWSADVGRVAASLLLLVSYVQLILGANLRHVGDMASPNVYPLLLMAHLVTAGAVLGLSLLVWYVTQASNWRAAGVRTSAWAFVFLVALQLAAGAATYVVKFGWPAWMGGFRFAAAYVIPEKTFTQVNLVTLHVAIGSLILATATYLSCRVFRAVWMCRDRRPDAA